MTFRIVFTGGGTAGHVAPNLALISAFKDKGWDMAYIGSAGGIEQEMIHPCSIPFYTVSSGKLRRYFSFKNFLDPFKILVGIVQATVILRRLKPDVVFSKGGFVAFPVVVGAWINRIPTVAHESDLTPGLANRLCFPFVNKICLTFAGGKKYFKNQEKIVVTGTPIRRQLFRGNKIKGLTLCGFDESRPCLLAIGGSLGAGSINRSLREALPELTRTYQVIHICGKGKLDPSLEHRNDYRQFEYVHDELADLFAAATVVVSRSGANSLYELLALGKPHVLIPLSAQVSRGDQIHNARYFKEQGISIVRDDASLNAEVLISALQELEQNREQIIAKMSQLNIQSGTAEVIAVIEEQLHVEAPGTV